MTGFPPWPRFPSMPAPPLPRISIIVCFVLAALSALPAAAAPDYEKDVLPILKQHCYSCHDGRKQTATLRLDLRARAFKGGESGDAGIVPGKPAESSLIERVAST